MVLSFFGWLILADLCLNIVSDCGHTNLIAQTSPKYLSSPNYPGNYQQSFSCTYKITANSTYTDVVIQILMVNASLEPATGCWRDSLEVIDGSRDFMRSLTSFCGDTWPKTAITSSGTTVLVLFNTDSQKNDYYGFLLAYWIAKKPLLVVNETPWSTVNYCLLGISIALLLVALISLLTMACVKIVRPRYRSWQREKIRRGSTIY